MSSATLTEFLIKHPLASPRLEHAGSPKPTRMPWNFPYRFLPEMSADDGQIGRSGGKTLPLL